jgi:hypothetical protein
VLNTLGVNTVVASLFDFDKVAELSANANVVINIVMKCLICVRSDAVLKPMYRPIQTA